ncbi:MAG TPA: methyltransferase domain-containing protein [Longimicrobiales bacterium]
MTALKRREHADELLDAPSHDMAELEQSLGHVASVNRWLGGVSAITRYVRPLFAGQSEVRLLDVATGSADIPLRIAQWARRHQHAVRIVASDIHPQMRELARRRCRDYPEITVESANALALPYETESFDASLLSLALHHFEGTQQTQVLREMARVSKRLVLVNDLERTRLNYVGARLLALTYWHSNRLTRHDGPLSVLRSFTRAELQAIGRNAGLGDRVARHFFQRIVLIGDARSARAAAVSTELR